MLTVRIGPFDGWPLFLLRERVCGLGGFGDLVVNLLGLVGVSGSLSVYDALTSVLPSLSPFRPPLLSALLPPGRRSALLGSG